MRGCRLPWAIKLIPASRQPFSANITVAIELEQAKTHVVALHLARMHHRVHACEPITLSYRRVCARVCACKHECICAFEYTRVRMLLVSVHAGVTDEVHTFCNERNHVA